MALVPGTRRGPYEVTDKIGAGGMGELYRISEVATALARWIAADTAHDGAGLASNG